MIDGNRTPSCHSLQPALHHDKSYQMMNVCVRTSDVDPGCVCWVLSVASSLLSTISSFVIANADIFVFSETLFCGKGPIVQEFYVTGCKSRCDYLGVITTADVCRAMLVDLPVMNQ